MAVKIDLSNTYLSANNLEDPSRLKIYDSDGKYIDYIPLDSRSDYFIEYADIICQLFFKQSPNRLTDRQTADLLIGVFHEIDDVIYNPDFDWLDETYGKEYVNRIGSCALIMKE